MLLSQLVCNHWMLLADVICHVVVVWLMFLAIVADGIATFVCLWKMKTTFEMIEDIFDCGRWYSHNVNWLMLLP